MCNSQFPRVVSLALLLGFGLSSLPLTSASLAAQSKPCVTMNWGGKLRYRTAGTSVFAIRASNGARILAFDGLEFYTRARSTTQTVTVSIWSAKGPMGTGTQLASGTMSVGLTLRAYRVKFSKTAIVPASSFFWIQFDRGTSIYMPTVLPGSYQTHYYKVGSRWSGPYSGTWNYRLFCKDLADVTMYGSGCLGSKPGCVSTTGFNWTQPLAGTTTKAKKIALLELSVSGSDPICGISMRCKAKSISKTLSVSAHAISWVGSKPVPGKLLGSTTMKVGTKAGEYKARFAKSFAPPVSGTVMFVLDQADQVVLPVSTKGTSGYHTEFDGTNWSALKWNYNWIYRLSRTPTAKAPLIGTQGLPLLGKQFSILLSQARPSSGSLFVLGASKKKWGTISLPLDLKVLGAPGCFLQASTDLAMAVSTDATGRASMALRVPNHLSLIGKHFFTQFLVYDPGANRLNLVASNAADAMVGRY